MKWTIRLLGYLSALFLLFGCLPKRALYFFPPPQNVSHEQQRQALSPVVTRDTDASLVAAAQGQPDSLPFTAATNPEVLVPAAFSRQPHTATKAQVQPKKAPASFRKQQARLVGLQKTISKKFSKNAQEKRPIHISAWLSFLFMMTGLVLLLVGTTGAGAYLGSYLFFHFSLISCVVAVITGIVGILRIKRNPGRFSGVGLASVSALISLLIVGAYLYGLLILLLFAYL
jgi:cation transport ATPase